MAGDERIELPTVVLEGIKILIEKHYNKIKQRKTRNQLFD